jgi:hypothetical protein
MKKETKRRKRCPRCKQLKPSGEVYEREDPYQAELNDDHNLYLMCNDCEAESLMDI